jgi:hypothetical protein
MGDERSMTGQFPYGWLRENIPILVAFLREKFEAQDVGELVILGDLFDQWVIPTDLDPIRKLDDICNNSANKDIIANLQKFAKSGKLVYVPGNHDMSACPEDIDGMKKFIEEKEFPGIRFICNADQPTGVYRPKEFKLVAEHGNMYCLFNAPDTQTVPGSFLPLGYFISRMVAYKVAETGKRENSLDIIVRLISKLIFDRFGLKVSQTDQLKNFRDFVSELKDKFKEEPNFISKFFRSVLEDVDAGLKESDEIKMGNMSGFQAEVTINDVANKYMQLMVDWDKTHNMIGSHVAIVGDTPLGLLWAAYRVYLETDPNTKIVIFGHTHAWKNEDPFPSLDENDQESDPSSPSRPCKGIYANSGTWIDSTDQCTYVETELDEDNQWHYVRVKSYPKDELLQELFVTL